MLAPSRFQRLLMNRQRFVTAAGLTLLECLVAIVMIGLSTAAVTPALVIAAATRVQTQKAEQSIQLAQGDIERVRLLLERGTYTEADLPPEANGITGAPGQLQTIDPPTALEEDEFSFTDDPSTARAVDINGDGEVDFIIQAWRSPGIGPNRIVAGQSVPVLFNMGVRVYDFRAFDNDPDALMTDAASLGTTGGEGERNRRPLAVIYASLGKGDLGSSLCDYFQVTGAAANEIPLDCP